MKPRIKRRLITRPIKVRSEAGSREKDKDDKAAVLRPGQFKELMERTARGQNPERNVAMLWHSFGSGLRVTEIAQLKVQDVITKSGKIKDVALLPGKYAKGEKARYFFQIDPAHQAALDTYINYRVQNGIRTSYNPKLYRGLQPESPLYIAQGTSGFSLTDQEQAMRKSAKTANNAVVIRDVSIWAFIGALVIGALVSLVSFGYFGAVKSDLMITAVVVGAISGVLVRVSDGW